MNPKFYFIRKMTWITMLLLSLSSNMLHAQIYANSQTNGVTGLCLLCGVSNPDNPVNNTNKNDYSTFNITIGLLGTTVYQTLIFPTSSTAGCDSLTIGIGSGNALLSLNLFGGVTVQTFNGATANNDIHVVDSSNLRLLQNNTRAEIMLKPVNTFDRVKITLSSSLVGLLDAFHLYYAYRNPAVPAPTAVDSTAICAGGITTLTATGVTGASISWYNAPVGGTLLSTGNNYVVSPETTTTYYAQASLNGCTSLRKAVKVIVNPRPANPIYTVPQGIGCGQVSIVVSNYQPGINYSVRVKYGQAFSTLLDTSFAVINNATINLPYFINNITYQTDIYVQAIQAFSGCKSDTVHQAFIRGGSAELPTVDSDSLTVCKGNNVTLHAYTPTSSFWPIRWYDAPTGGNLLHIGNFYTLSPNQTATYYVTAASVCEYPYRKPVKVIVTKLPDPIYTVPEGFVCGNRGSLSLPVSNYQSGLSYNVRNIYTANNILLLDTSYVVTNSNTIVTPVFLYTIPVQSDIYVQAVDAVTGCKSDSIHQQFVLDAWGAYPSVDNDNVSICHGDSVTLHAFVPTAPLLNIRWYDALSGGNLLYTGNYYKVSPSENTTYYVTSSFSCEYPDRRPVNVTVNDCLARTALLSKGEKVSPEMMLKQLKLFPNPTSGEVWLAVGDKDLTGSLVIVRSLDGKEVQRETLKKNSFRFLNRTATGLYFIQVITLKKEVYSGKVLLQ